MINKKLLYFLPIMIRIGYNKLMLQPRKKLKIVGEKNMEKGGGQQIVIFRLERPLDREPQQQLIINQKPRKLTKVEDHQTQEMKLCEQFLSKAKIGQSVQYFLKKVNAEDLIYETPAQKIIHEELLPKAVVKANRQRFALRNALMQKARDIKVVELKQEQVELGGQKILVQNLGGLEEDFYTLHKRKQRKSGIEIDIPEEAQEYLKRLQFDEEEQQFAEEEDDEDSNRESNPDYDYPDQQSEGSDDEGIIKRVQESDNQGSSISLDQQELYRRYLKRCQQDVDDDDDVQYY